MSKIHRNDRKHEEDTLNGYAQRHKILPLASMSDTLHYEKCR